MSFSKNYFQTIGQRLDEYRALYPCGEVTVTVRVNDEAYHAVRILWCDDDLVTFAYYVDEKSNPLGERGVTSGEPTAWPALTVPYDSIDAVEFSPGKVAGEKRMGFIV